MLKLSLIKKILLTWYGIKTFIISLKQNWFLRILALLIAFSVWVYVTRDQKEVVMLNVPLNVSVAKGFQFEAFTTNGLPIENLTLEIICAVRDKPALRDFDYKSEINLSEESENTIPSYLLIPGKDVKYVRGDENSEKYILKAISPDRIKIIIDKSEQRNILVKANTNGVPAEGYQVTKIEINPSAVLVKGPERLLKELESVSTEPILIGRLQKPQSFKRKIVTGDNNIIVINQQTVEVTVGINTKPLQKSFESIKINPLGLDKISFTPPNVSVFLEAQKQIMDIITPNDITAFIDARNVRDGGYQLPVKILPIENCNVISVMPQTVTVNMRTFSEK